VPAHERLWSHHDEKLSPVDQPSEHNECDTSGIVQAPRLDLPLDIERQLLAQEQVLGCEVICDEEASTAKCSRSRTRRSAVRIIRPVDDTGRSETAVCT
jgi:hypothetical protein